MISLAAATATAAACHNKAEDIPGSSNSHQKLDSPIQTQAGESRKARILVIEDNAFVREGIISLIDGQPDLCCCGEADSVGSTPTAVAKCKPDLVLTDLRFKDGDAFELMNSVALERPRLPVLVLSQCDEVLYAERALQAGARGYVMKVEAADELLNAIRAVLQGKVYLSRAMSSRLLQRVLKPGLNANERKNRERTL